MKIIALSIFAYLLGSLCSAIILCRLLKLPDPRTVGSHNPGATNVLRLAGKKIAAFVLLFDALKGLIPVVVGRLVGIDGFALGMLALFAFLGHLFPIYFKLKGGKGVATAFGGLLGLSPLLGIAAAIIWGIIIKFSRYVSLASLCVAILTPIFSFYMTNPLYFIPILIMSLLLIWRHRANITRLLSRAENKF